MLPSEVEILGSLLLEMDKRGGKVEPVDAYKSLSVFFDLSDEDTALVNESDGRSKWENRVWRDLSEEWL